MNPRRDLQREWQAVAVVRALPGLGDFLCAVPALRALRKALPGARIELVGLPSTAALINRFPEYIDALVPFPGYPGIPEVPFDGRRLGSFIAAARRKHYDLVVQLHGDGSIINEFALALGGTETFGFHPAGEDAPDPVRFIPYRPGEPEIRRSLRLIRHLGVPSAGTHLEFPLSALDAARLDALPEAGALGSAPYAVLHPGASAPTKRWQPEHFALVGDRLAAAGLTPVLTGDASEVSLTRAVKRLMRSHAIDLGGKTSLGMLAELISRSALLVANDTGVSHLAAAFKVPSVIVFCQSERTRWAPLDAIRHRSVGAGIGVGTIATGGPDLAAVLAEVEDVLRIGGSRAS